MILKLKETLNELRIQRNFNSHIYLNNKIKAINDFFNHWNLNSAVIGISGGIDSAVTLALLLKASNELNSPIKLIRPLILPIYSEGTTNQENASSKAFDFIKSLNSNKLDYKYIDLTEPYNNILKLNDKTNIWANGQLCPMLRTSIFYYNASILQANNYKSIVVGTMNYSEGSYIGYFGKGSDAMVDLQIIDDIYKSEVYQIAELLNIPDYIINAVPNGDVWDGKSDEEMIGCTYDMLELILLCKKYKVDLTYITDFKTDLDKIEYLHNINRHKYVVGRPYHSLNIEIC